MKRLDKREKTVEVKKKASNKNKEPEINNNEKIKTSSRRREGRIKINTQPVESRAVRLERETLC